MCLIFNIVYCSFWILFLFIMRPLNKELAYFFKKNKRHYKSFNAKGYFWKKKLKV